MKNKKFISCLQNAPSCHFKSDHFIALRPPVVVSGQMDILANFRTSVVIKLNPSLSLTLPASSCQFYFHNSYR